MTYEPLDPPAPVTSFLDTFTEADNTDLCVHVPDSDTGYGWVIREGYCLISGSKVIAGAATSHAITDTGSADGTLTADLVVSDAGTHRVQILLRYIDFDNHWMINLGENETLDLYQVTLGAWTLRSSVPFAPVVGTTYPITVTLSGSDITATVGGKTVTYSSTFNRAITLHGFRIVGIGTTTKGSVDNFTFTKPAVDTTRAQANVLVDAYHARTGIDNAKYHRIADIIKWLIDADLWSHVKHCYLTIKGFNASSGATIYDLVAPGSGGEDLTQSGCTLPTSEGQALTKGAAASITSTNALIPTSGAHSIVIGFRFQKAVGTTVFKQDAATPYQLTIAGTNMANSKYLLAIGDGNTYELDDHYPYAEPIFTDQALWNEQPVALIYNNTSGRIFSYTNRDFISKYETGDGTNDGIVATPVVPNSAFEIPAGADFDMEYLLILDAAISGVEYQLLTYQIDKAITPHSPTLVNSGLMWLDTRGVKIPCSSFGMWYDSRTDKYYLYDTSGMFPIGIPPNNGMRGGHYGVECYSSYYLNGPWTYEGAALKMNQASFLDPMSVTYPSDAVVVWPGVSYLPSRSKYIMAGKCQSPRTIPVSFMLMLAESDTPIGPFTVTYAGLIDSEDVGDLCLFIDADNTGYVVYDIQGGTGVKIVQLNATCTAPTGSGVVIDAAENLESPAMVKVGSRYWIVATHKAGWDPGYTNAYYSDAATPMSGWILASRPFTHTPTEWADISFYSQTSDLFTARDGSLVYAGTRQIYRFSKVSGMHTQLCRGVVLPVTISGDAMTIEWDAHWIGGGDVIPPPTQVRVPRIRPYRRVLNPYATTIAECYELIGK